jgi:hypothetical protein
MRLIVTCCLLISLVQMSVTQVKVASGSTALAVVSTPDSLRIYQLGYNAGYAAKVCPPSGFTQAQLDSAYRAGLAKYPDSLTLGGAWPVKVYIPKP